jgi:hypothetical protein
VEYTNSSINQKHTIYNNFMFKSQVYILFKLYIYILRGRHGRDRMPYMVVGFTTTCAISDYHH